MFVSNCLKCLQRATFNIKTLNCLKLRASYNSPTYQYPLKRHFYVSACVFKRRKTAEEKKAPKQVEYAPKFKGDFVDVWINITIGELAKALDAKVSYVEDLFLGTLTGYNTPITNIKELQNAIRRSGRRIHFIAKPVPHQEEKITKVDAIPRPPPTKAQLKLRPPVVTVMGHVDHGKTTLLDALRNSRVVDQEFGGITQHIGAFSVNLPSKGRVTFLDTPGHAAFTSMRARGANATDLVVLVVAADDGVMEQTVESVRMAREAKVPILVAINKIDAAKADVERTETMLMQVGLQSERFGGDVQVVHISALKRINLDQLVEALITQAELLEVGGDPTGFVEAVVIESRVDIRRGKLCTVVIKRGTLKPGQFLVAGTCYARVKQLLDTEGQTVQEVTPGYPVEIEGWKELPEAGELVLQVESIKRAKSVIELRRERIEELKAEEDVKAIKAKEEQHEREYKEQLKLRRKMGRFKLRNKGPRKPEIAANDEISFNVVIKSDVNGTLEAILETLDTYDDNDCKMDLVHYGVGAVNETDVEFAESFQGVIYAFNVDCPAKIKEKAEELDVKIKHFNVIYKLVDDVKEEINSRLPPKEVEEIIGEATVLQQFIISEGRKKVSVAGCKCSSGQLKKTAIFKVMRNGELIHEGPLASMRHLKNEVDIIKTDMECGLQLSDKSVTFEPFDTVICLEKHIVAQTTKWDPGF